MIMTTAENTTRTGSVELQIGGMTCAACANRVEKKLNKLDGVSASVNYATEKAKRHRVPRVWTRRR
jgi:Cu+-exporting ATPase